MQPPPPSVVLGAVTGRPGHQADALLLERGDEGRRRILVLVGEDPRKDLDRGDARAEPGVDLGELDPDGPSPQDGDRRGDRLGLPDGLLVGPVGALLDALDRWRHGLAAGSQDDPFRLDPGAIRHLDPVRAHQASLLHEDPDPDPLEGLGPAARLRLDDVPGPVPNGEEVHVHGRDPHPEPVCVPGQRGDLGASEHDLGRNAAVEVAFAPQLVPLGQADRHPPVASQPEGDLRARRAAADHEDVEPLHPVDSITRERSNRVNSRQLAVNTDPR